jgi:hypothetical protein
MSERKQSLSDQAMRLNEGCCPIHGLFMTQIDSLTEYFSVVMCSRKDCGMMAIEREPGHVLTLITGAQLTRLNTLVRDMEMQFWKQAGEKIAVELQSVATSPEVQLPIA